MGYSSFSDLLEEAMAHGLLTAERDERAGGTFVVTAVGGKPGPLPATNGSRRSSRRRGRRRRSDTARKEQAPAIGETGETGEEKATAAAAEKPTTTKKATKKT